MPPLKQLSQWAEYGLLIWLAAVLAILAYRGLVSGKLRQLVVSPLGDGSVSPARVQALGVTVGFAGWYLSQGLETLSSTTPHLPDVKPETLSIVVASLGVHMGGKLYERRPRGAASAAADSAEPLPKPKSPRRRKSDGEPKP